MVCPQSEQSVVCGGWHRRLVGQRGAGRRHGRLCLRLGLSNRLGLCLHGLLHGLLHGRYVGLRRTSRLSPGVLGGGGHGRLGGRGGAGYGCVDLGLCSLHRVADRVGGRKRGRTTFFHANKHSLFPIDIILPPLPYKSSQPPLIPINCPFVFPPHGPQQVF